MEPEYRVITREIDAKDKGYLLIRRCPPEALRDTVRRGANQLLEAGASLLFAASLDPDAPLSEGTGQGFKLLPAHEMVRMERAADAPRPAGVLTLEPLTRQKGGQWLTLHNECFFDVPNSATYGPEELERALNPGQFCGFVLRAGVPVGLYELDCTGDIPEIAGIGLLKDVRGQGLGTELLRACLALLASSGAERCFLRVSTANEAACGLYRRTGFVQTAVVSRWYQILPAGEG